MKRIEIGQHLQVSYTPGTMRVVSLIRGCTCAHALDEMNVRPQLGEVATPLPPHLHMELRYTEHAPEHLIGDHAGLNYYDELTLRKYGAGGKICSDYIMLVENPHPVQISLAI